MRHLVFFMLLLVAGSCSIEFPKPINERVAGYYIGDSMTIGDDRVLLPEQFTGLSIDFIISTQPHSKEVILEIKTTIAGANESFFEMYPVSKDGGRYYLSNEFGEQIFVENERLTFNGIIEGQVMTVQANKRIQ